MSTRAHHCNGQQPPDLRSAGNLVALAFKRSHLRWRFLEAPIELRCRSQCLPEPQGCSPPSTARRTPVPREGGQKLMLLDPCPDTVEGQHFPGRQAGLWTSMKEKATP